MELAVTPGYQKRSNKNIWRVPIIDVSCGVAGVAKVAGKVNKQKSLNKSWRVPIIDVSRGVAGVAGKVNKQKNLIKSLPLL